MRKISDGGSPAHRSRSKRGSELVSAVLALIVGMAMALPASVAVADPATENGTSGQTQSQPSAPGVTPRGGRFVRPGSSCILGTSSIRDCFGDMFIGWAVAKELGVNVFSILTQDMADNVHTLNVISATTSELPVLNDFSGMEVFHHLKKLNLNSHSISDVSGLASQTSLEELDLGGNKISDISPLAGLTQLKKLNLSECPIKDDSISGNGSMAVIAGFKQLEELNLGRITMQPRLQDVTPLLGLNKLKKLNLHFNKIGTDGFNRLAATSFAPNLTSLDVTFNEVDNMSAIVKFGQLQEFMANSNRISDPSPLTSLRNITNVDLSANKIPDISSLTSAPFPNLTRMNLINQSLMEPSTNVSTNVTVHSAIITRTPAMTYAGQDTTYRPLPESGFSFDAPTGSMTWASVTAPAELKFRFTSKVSVGPLRGVVYSGISKRGVTLGRQVTYEAGPGASWASPYPSEWVDDGARVTTVPSAPTGLTPPAPGMETNGWEYATSSNGPKVGSFEFGATGTPVTSNIWVRPHWSYRVHFEAGPDGSTWNQVPNDVLVDPGQKVGALSSPSQPQRTHYNQVGWEYSRSSNGPAEGGFVFDGDPATPGTTVNNEIWVRPLWEPMSYAVNYDWNGGSWNGQKLPTSAKYADFLSAPAVSGLSVPAHQHFDHWEVAASASGPWTTFTAVPTPGLTMPGHDIWIRPSWVTDQDSGKDSPDGPGGGSNGPDGPKENGKDEPKNDGPNGLVTPTAPSSKSDTRAKPEKGSKQADPVRKVLSETGAAIIVPAVMAVALLALAIVIQLNRQFDSEPVRHHKQD
ncbi:Leucine Rich repeat-containing protein [Bifidobacterium commune]|uniref:Leucine Rich repeat-containing protein n=1 Tax=Bifidobacterium commune TaxID=1505727 RepID=A0A1C4H6I2_9BIFI|nr:leucine-rich repeat domain-containing protein [Bifidobacterium commune]SCC80392.1 Leucine Rich repeat-containing protein [Bifidobacterium commune]